MLVGTGSIQFSSVAQSCPTLRPHESQLNILKLIMRQATMSDHLERGIYELTQ